jgi:hypothetical protein
MEHQKQEQPGYSQFVPNVQAVTDGHEHLVRLAAVKKMYPDMYLNMFSENALTNPKQIVYFGHRSVGNDEKIQVEVCGQDISCKVESVLLSEFLGLRQAPGATSSDQVCFVALPEIPFQLDDTGTKLMVGGHGMCKVMSVGLVVSVASRSLVVCNFYVVNRERQFLQVSYTVNRKVNCSLRALRAIGATVL